MLSSNDKDFLPNVLICIYVHAGWVSEVSKLTLSCDPDSTQANIRRTVMIDEEMSIWYVIVIASSASLGFCPPEKILLMVDSC